MLAYCGLYIVFLALTQAVTVPPVLEDILEPEERARLEQGRNIDRRIKVYDSVSQRIQKEIMAAVLEGDFQNVPEKLRQWNLLLSVSLKDIDSNLRGKKKPKSLKKYEINIRKSISETENYKFDAPLDQQDVMEAYIEQAEEMRKRFVDLLFEQ